MSVHPMQTIAEESPQAAGLVASILEASARERDSIEDSLRSALETERDEWRERALSAEAQLRSARKRVLALFDPFGGEE